MVQITYNLNGSYVSHASDTCGVNNTHVFFLDNTHVFFLDSTRLYTHTQYLHMRVHAHAVFKHACVFTHVHACMANVAS